MARQIAIATNEQNSLTGKSMKDLSAILADIAADDRYKAAVLCSENPKFFCNGIDAENILNLPKEKLLDEMGQIVLLFADMMRFDKPLFAEVSGYAMGGGAVLTVAADYRNMVTGKARICFTEVMVGLPLPGSFVDRIQLVVRPEFINQVCFEAVPMKAEAAKETGLIQEVAEDAAGLRVMTVKKLESLAKIPVSAIRHTKSAINRGVIENLEKNAERMGRILQDPVIIGNLLEGMSALKEKRRPEFR